MPENDHSSAQPQWFFIKEDPNHRVRSTTYDLPSGATELSTEARVAREAIQNSADATPLNEATNVLVWNKTIGEAEVDSFRKLIGFGLDQSPFKRLDALGLGGGNALRRMASDRGSRQFPVTIIEDRNTCGLGWDEVDRFNELCIAYGQESTDASAKRGGSYGFGKGVYQEASDSNLFVVYSVFRPHPRADEPEAYARLLACATFDGHQIGPIKFTGRALYGKFKKRDGQTLCRPVVNEEAHDIAQGLGFLRRRNDDFGTSIMIIGSRIDTDALRAEIENYWWPRMWSNKLSVELWHGDDEVSPPEPKRRSDLMPFTKCYSYIEEGIPIPKVDRRISIRKNATAIHPTLQEGILALTPLLESEEVSEDVEEDTRLENAVALVRSGPRMVVQYMPPGGYGSAKFAGVFVSHEEVETQLHLSEPPAHDAWDPLSLRLAKRYASDPQKVQANRDVVAHVLRNIKNHTRKFRRDLSPAPTPVQVSGTPALRSILNRLMSSAGTKPVPRGGGQPRPRPFDLRSDGHRRFRNGDSAHIVAKAEIHLNDNWPNKEADATVLFLPFILMDDDFKKDQSAPIGIVSMRVDGVDTQFSENAVRISLSNDRPVVVEAVTDGFDADLYAHVDVEVGLNGP